VQDGRRLGAELIGSGKAFDRFRRLVELQGGEAGCVEDSSRLPKAQGKLDVASRGREKEGDGVDPAAGIVLHKKVAQPVKAGEPLCTIHYNSQARLDRARPLIEQGFQIGDLPREPGPIVRKVIES